MCKFKKILALMLAGTMAVSLCACSNEEKNEDESYSTTVSIDGTATECTGTDISTWVNYEDISSVSIALSDIASYRTNGASKAVPGFDVIDYGQEDYVFGDSEQDARHWNSYLLEIFEEYVDTLARLFNK